MNRYYTQNINYNTVFIGYYCGLYVLNYPKYSAMKKKNSVKFLTIFNSFSETEKKEFYFFVKSSLSKTGRDFRAIIDKLDKGAEGVIELQNMYNNRTIWNRLSELTRVAEKFLVIKELTEDKQGYSLLLLRQLRKRKLHKTYDSFYYKSEKELMDAPVSYEAFKKLSELTQEKLSYVLAKGSMRDFQAAYKETSNYRIVWFLLDYLSQLTELAQQKFNNLGECNLLAEKLFGTVNFEKLLTEIEKDYAPFYPYIALQYYVLMGMLNIKENKYYVKAKEIFISNTKKFSNEYKTIVYFMLINYCLNVRNLKIMDVDDELFSLYDSKLKEGLYDDLTATNVTLNHFRDYIIIALNLGKYDWVNNFIRKYVPLLPEEYRDNDTKIGYALLHFSKKEYKTALKYVKDVSRNNYLRYMDSSRISVICNYELFEYEKCYSELDSLKHYFIRQENIPVLTKQLVKNFIVLVSLLLHCTDSPEPARMDRIDIEIKKNRPTLALKWIKEKIALLKNTADKRKK